MNLLVGVIDMQGFNLCNSEKKFKFFAKEITITNGQQTEHFLIKPPTPFYCLNDESKRHVVYEEKHYHCLLYSSGYVNYSNAMIHLNKLLSGFEAVYVKGSQKYLLLKQCKFICEENKRKIFEVDVNFHVYSHIPQFKKQIPKCMNHTPLGYYETMCSKSNAIDLLNSLYNLKIV